MVMRRVRLAILGFLGSSTVLAVALLGCNAVLGIGAATLDPEAGKAAESGSGDDGAGGGDAGADGSVGRALSCDYYCRTVTQNCTGQNSEFEGTEDVGAICQTVCQAYDVGHAGTIAATDDDTLGCRIFYAEAALANPDLNCRFAGPLGGGRCGTDPCQLFCALALQYCSGPPLPAQLCTSNFTDKCTPYGTSADCLAACRGDGGYPYIRTGSDLLDNTNTLNCRMYHLENAYGSAASQEFHCPHTAQVSMVCVP
jgi:hypothetical protein